jgi:hypothetical protein
MLCQTCKSEPAYLKTNLKGRHNVDTWVARRCGYIDLGRLSLNQRYTFLKACFPSLLVISDWLTLDSFCLANPDLSLFSGMPTGSNPASDESFALTKAWIHSYLTSQEHAFCSKLNKSHMSSLLQKSLGEPAVPARLIDVGPSDGSQEPTLSSACRLSTKWK